MSVCELLKHHIDQNRISYKDISQRTGINISSIRSGLCNDQLSFEKLSKIAIISSFDLLAPVNFSYLKVRYKLDAEDMKQRIRTYEAALKDRVIMIKSPSIEEVLHEAEVDTSFAIVCKMQAAAEQAEKKKRIPVPENLDQEVEAVVNNEREENLMENVEQAETLQKVEKDNVNHPNHYCKDGQLECIEVIKSIVANLQGIEAVEVANIIKYIYRYKDKNGVEDLKKARWYLDELINSLGA